MEEALLKFRALGRVTGGIDDGEADGANGMDG